MITEQHLLKTWRKLPKTLQQQVLDFMSFLLERRRPVTTVATSETPICPPFPQTTLADVAGCLHHEGSAKTPQEMDKAIGQAITNIPESAQAKALTKAKEAYVMTLLAEGEISSGKAASLLDMSRLDMLEHMGKWDISVFDDTLSPTELEQQVNQANEALNQSKPEHPAA